MKDKIFSTNIFAHVLFSILLLIMIDTNLPNFESDLREVENMF